MNTRVLSCAVALSALLGSACDRPNNATTESRPDATANDRAAQTSNTTDNDDRSRAATTTSDDKTATATTGDLDRRADRIGDKIGDAADRAAADGSKAANKTGEVINDAWITTKIQAQFTADDVVKARHIDVDTKDGVVSLKGSVHSKVEKDKAEQLARQTEGVKRVVNNLKVDPSANE